MVVRFVPWKAFFLLQEVRESWVGEVGVYSYRAWP